MIWIVSGVSSVGKSTFIGSQRAYEITGLSSEAKVVFPFDAFEELSISDRDFFFHYNIMRPFWIILRRHPIMYLLASRPNLPCYKYLRKGWFWRRFGKRWNYKIDSKWSALVATRQTKNAIVLITNPVVLLERVHSREHGERLGASRRRTDYKGASWGEVYKQVDLLEIHMAWLRELESVGIEYLILDATDHGFEHIMDLARMEAILRGES